MKLWVGYEQEGMFKDVYTLFIGAYNIKFEEIKNILSKMNRGYHIGQIYFGAGKCTKINYKLVDDIINLEPKNFYGKEPIITLEITPTEFMKIKDNKKIISRCNFIITFNNKEFNILNYLYKESCQIKLQNLGKKKAICLFDCHDMLNVNLDNHIDKVYKGDVVLK